MKTKTKPCGPVVICLQGTDGVFENKALRLEHATDVKESKYIKVRSGLCLYGYPPLAYPQMK